MNSSAELASRLRKLEVRVANLVRIGRVATLDELDARVTVEIGHLLTAPLPWLTQRAGPDCTWWAPEPGEQVVVFSPSGELTLGVVLPAIYQTAFPAPAAAKTIHRTVYTDGTMIEYDRAAHKLTATVNGTAEITTTGALTLKGSSIILDGPVSATGNVSAPDLISTTLGFGFNAHKHTIPNVGITTTPHT